MVRGMSTTSLATGLSCACGGVVAGGRQATAGRGVWSSRTRATMVYASGVRVSPSLGGMGPKQQYGISGGNSVSRRQLGSGMGRRGGADLLWLVMRVSGGEKTGFGDGGGDYTGGSGGMGGGGGGGGGGDAGGGGGESDGSGDASQISPHVGAAIWVWYNSLLETHPLVSKSLTAGLMNAFADLFCQVFIEKLDEIDWKRLVSFMSIGIFLSGPGLHFWYGALPKIVPMPGFGGVLIRIALDQLVFTPLGMISFFVVLLTLEDRRDDIRKKLEKDFWPTVIANWKVWIPFQIVNFGLIPPQLQVAAAGLLGMGWSVFISYKGHTR